MSFNLQGRTIQEQLRIDEAYYNIFSHHPNYYDLPVFDPDIYDTHITIILPLGQTNFTDEDLIRIAVELNNLGMPICGFNFHQHFLCFETIEGYYEMSDIENVLNNYTHQHQLPSLEVVALRRPD